MKLPCLAACLLMAGQALAAPQRIVSLNPCTDAMLVEIADPSTIAALSFYSRDPASTSIPLATAQRFASTSGTAESILRLSPDLVIGSSYTPPQTRVVLAKFGIDYVAIDQPNTVAESVAQIRQLASRLEAKNRSENLVARIQQAARLIRARKISALVVRHEGLVLGTGSLTADLMARAGFDNVSARYGIAAWGALPLEKLLRTPPPVLLRAQTTRGDRARGESLLTHPALLKIAGKTQTRVLPSTLLNCGGPTIIPAMQKLRALRESVRAS